MNAKKALSGLCVLVCLVVPAWLVVRLRSNNERNTAPAPVAANATVQAALPASAPVSSQQSHFNEPESYKAAAQHFVTRMAQWESARYPESDQIEEELKALIDDENAAVLLQALPPHFQTTYLALQMLERWAKRHRLAAVQWLASRPEQTRFQVMAVVRDWGVDDNDALFRYVDVLPPGSWKEQITAALAQDTLRNQDPELAFSIASLLSPSDEKLRLLRDAVLKWSTWDPRAVLVQVERLPDPHLQEELITYVATGYATDAPGEAANWVIQSLGPGELLERGVAGVVGIWVSRHRPADAAQWVEQLPLGPLQDHALQVLVSAWGERNPLETSDWIERLPDGLRGKALTYLGHTRGGG